MNPEIRSHGLKKRPNIIRNELRYFRQNIDLTSLALPSIIIIFILCYIPMFGIILAFKDFHYDSGIFGSPWVGLNNFKFFFNSSDAFRITRNTIGYNLIYIALGTIVSVTFAILLNELSRRWIKLYQTILFVPYFISWVVGGYLVLSLLDPQYGFLNNVLALFGGGNIEWYSNSRYWPFILVFMNLWKYVGFNTLIYYTGIMGIDSTYYEAGEIDGANRIQMTFHITVPMLKRLISILIILALGNIFRGDFGLHYFVPNNAGALYGATDVIDTYAFRALRTLGDIPMSSAVSAFQSLVGLITVLAANIIIKKIDEESALF